MSIKRGEIFWIYLDPTKGAEQAGGRPCLILQNNVGNDLAPTTIIAPLTSKSYSKEFPTNVNIPGKTAGLVSNSTVILSQIRTIDKRRIGKKIGTLPDGYIEKVSKAIKKSLDL